MYLKHFLKRYLVFTLFMVVFAACKKDSQDKYEPINDIKINDATTSFTIPQLDSLIIAPKLVETMPAGDSFTYSWTIDSKVISESKNLRIKVTLSPGTYLITYKVTSNKNGIYTLQRYTVIVNGVYPNGWYVVNIKDGKGRASLIRNDGVIFENPMEVANNKVYAGKPLALSNFGKGGFFYYFTDQNVYRFNMNDWLEIGDKSSILPNLATPLPFKSAPAFILNASKFDQFIVVDGDLYAGIAGSATDNIRPFSQRIPGNYNLFPGVFPNTYDITYFYDNANMRFMRMGLFSRVLEDAPSTTGTFNLANVGRKMIASDRGKSTLFEEEIEFYYIMEDNTGRYLMSLTYSPFGQTLPGVNQKFVNSPEIDSVTKFASSSIVKQLYYTVGNNVYLYDILAQSARLIYTFPAGNVIKDIKMLRNTSKQLVIGVNNGTAGEVYYFSINGQGEFNNGTYDKKFTGFGEIVQIANARENL